MYPDAGVYGGSCWFDVAVPLLMGLRPSLDKALGGVRRLPTLVKLEGGCEEAG